MDAPAEVLLLLGGNRGDVAATLDRAAILLAERAGRVLSTSRDHWTEPWGFHDDTLFLNRALLLSTRSSPKELLDVALRIESELGRMRSEGEGYGPRTIDIDILLFGDLAMEGPGLTVPHPLMHLRPFALAPASDVSPSMVHPIRGLTVLELLNDLRHP